MNAHFYYPFDNGDIVLTPFIIYNTKEVIKWNKKYLLIVFTNVVVCCMIIVQNLIDTIIL
jgi:hypothetical protein